MQQSSECNNNKKLTHGYREQTTGYQQEREVGRGNIGIGDEEVQTIGYKISYKDIVYNPENIVNILQQQSMGYNL